MSEPDWYNMLCAKRGAPDGWKWFELKALGTPNDPPEAQGILIRGAVCTAVYARGKRKGEPNWSKRDKSTEREHFATMEQIRQLQSAWEAETKQCAKCGGTGQVFASWNAMTGTARKPCINCDGTGVKP